MTSQANSLEISEDALKLLADLVEHPGQCLGYDFRVKALDEDGLIGWASELHGYYATPKGVRYAERQVAS